VLIAKLALILPLLGVAGINAVLLKPALVDAVDDLHEEDAEQRPSGEERARLEARLQRLQRALPRTILAEFLLGVAVLASVSVLAQSTTAEGELRQAASRASGDFTASGEADDLSVELTISPFGLGVNTYSLRLDPKSGAELGEILSVRLIAVFDDPNAPPSAGTTGTSLELEPTDEAEVYAAEAALLTQPGDWRVQARIRRRGMYDSATGFIPVSEVGGFLARGKGPEGLFDLPFTFVDWNIVAGGAMLVLGLGAFLIWNNRPPSWRRGVSTSVGASSAFAMLGGVVLIFGVHTHETVVPRTSPVPATEESLAIGLDIYEVNCLTCHGRKGRGDGPSAATLAFPPADLNQHVPYHSDGTLFLWTSEGLPIDSDQKNMPAFKDQLTQEERWHVINFLREAFGSGAFEPVLPDETSQSSQRR
jgi:mono/diheme cytochrome c family protein